MKIRLLATAVLVLLACWVWLKNQGVPKSEDGDAASSRIKIRHSESISGREASGVFRTKVANREPTGPRATHAPERLKEFMLPEVVINGLTLSDALQKLMGVYEETCGKTGEIPLRLTFDLPPGSSRKIKLKLSPRNFNSSVQLLATYSGMKVSRTKKAYHFEPFPNEQKQANLAMRVPPDFASRLIEQVGIPPLSCFEQFKNPSFVEASPVPLPLGQILEMSGLVLDPSTRLSLGPSGSLTLETTSSADAAVVSALTATLSSEIPTQQKFTSQLVELPAGTHWALPDASQMTDGEMAQLMRDLAQTNGAELQTLPSVTSRNGQDAAIEITREFTYPADESGEKFEKRNVGKALLMRGDLLGFGQEVDLQFTDTTGGIDSSTGKAAFEKRTEIADKSFTGDGATKLLVQTRPDGSQTVLLYKSQTIDATGRPVH